MNNIETLESYWSAEAAQLNKNLLEAEGIPCFLQGVVTSSTLWHLANASGGVRLQVPQSELHRAASVLQAFRQAPADDDESDRAFGFAALSTVSNETHPIGAPLEELAGEFVAEEITRHPDDSEHDEDDADGPYRPGLFEKFRNCRALIVLACLAALIWGI
ncbi:MAG: putative prokaryotic signal transducing protein [Planctomycetaceae bacterium]|nr:putative prokaryotic signal transducing protein [Planctomycetaceae bacterium]